MSTETLNDLPSLPDSLRLRWARERAGMSPEEVARVLSLATRVPWDPEDVLRMESLDAGGALPAPVPVFGLAWLYGVPLAWLESGAVDVTLPDHDPAAIRITSGGRYDGLLARLAEAERERGRLRTALQVVLGLPAGASDAEIVAAVGRRVDR